MIKSINFNFIALDLQLFAEGGDGGTGAEGTSGVSAGVPGQQSRGGSLSEVRYGIQDDEQTEPNAPAQTAADDQARRSADFDALIKGEYKDLYDKKVQDIVQKRLKGSKETVDKFNALTPTLELLAKKYGVDPSDVDALGKAINEDDTYWEDEALEKGVSVDQLKEIRRIERENESLKNQMRDQEMRENADRIYADWLDQANQMQNLYPGFNLDNELNNPKFTDLLRSGIDVRTAFEVLHKDEIVPVLMQHSAQVAQTRIANNIIANGARPRENGIGNSSPAVVKTDVTQLSKADRQEIARRVAMGERIRF